MSATPSSTLRDELLALPPNATVEFDFAVLNLLEAEKPARESLRELRDHSDLDVAFAAHYALLTKMWRDRDFTEYRTCVEAGAKSFASVPLQAGLEAQAKLSSTDPKELRYGLKLARRARETNPSRPSVLHTLAEMVACLGESGDATAEELQEGEKAVLEAISLVPGDHSYSKYHATLARLLALQRSWYEAEKQITTAIELEPWSGEHYVLRLGLYQYIRSSIAFGKRADELRQKQDAAQRELEAMRSEVLTLVGLLAAVIAFIVSGVQIATELRTVAHATEVMAALAGAILAVFAGFSLLFAPAREWRWSGGVLALGLILISGVWSVDRWA